MIFDKKEYLEILKENDIIELVHYLNENEPAKGVKKLSINLENIDLLKIGLDFNRFKDEEDNTLLAAYHASNKDSLHEYALEVILNLKKIKITKLEGLHPDVDQMF